MIKFGLAFLILPFAFQVFANTEIINFHVPESHNSEAIFTKDWLRINNTHAQHRWSLPPAPYGTPMKQVCNGRETETPQSACPHELWVTLDLSGQWNTSSKFTLRLSWPAHYPSEFQLQLYDPETLSAHFNTPVPIRKDTSVTDETRVRYARIRVVEGSLHVPTDEPFEPPAVPFIIVIEPLYFGVLPPSILPVLGYIALACVFTYLVAPPIYGYLLDVAREARKEFDAKEKDE